MPAVRKGIRVGSGLYVSDNGLIYRGGCTDRIWKEPSCSTYCVDTQGKNAGAILLENTARFMLITAQESKSTLNS